MQIKLIKDLSEELVEKTLKHQVEKMNQAGNFQWDDNYPHFINFQQDIEQKQLYGFYEDDLLCAVAALTTDYEAHYYEKPHNFRYTTQNDKIMYIHRMMKLDGVKVKNIGSKVLKTIIETYIEQYDAIQVDTNLQNIPMTKAIESVGFIKKGSFDRFEYKSPHWQCYEFCFEELK